MELGQEGMVLPSKFRVIRKLRAHQASPVCDHKAQDCFVLSCGSDLCLRAGGEKVHTSNIVTVTLSGLLDSAQERKLSRLPSPGFMSSQACGEGQPFSSGQGEEGSLAGRALQS